MEAFVATCLALSVLISLAPAGVEVAEGPFVRTLRQVGGMPPRKTAVQHAPGAAVLRLARFLSRVPSPTGPRRDPRSERLLAWSGLGERFTVDDLRGLRLLAALATALYMAVIGAVSGSGAVLPAALFLGVMGYLVPDRWLAARARRRRERLEKELPSFLNLLAVAMEAGHNLVPAIREVSSRRRGPLASEFQRALERVDLGQPVGDALAELADRSGSREVERIISTVRQALEKGASGVAAILKEEAHGAWMKRRNAAEEVAQKASIKLFFPLVFLIFPAMAILLLYPVVLGLVGFFRGVGVL